MSAIAFVSSLQATNSEVAAGSQLHVRGIGVHGWDGTDEGTGEYEDVEALRKLLLKYGELMQATVRHRIQDPESPEPKMRGPRANASWALVTMKDKAAADKVFAVSESDPGLWAGENRLKVTRFSADLAKKSKGKMSSVLKDDIAQHTKMTKRWCVVVSVDSEGQAVAKADTGRRAMVFFASKMSMKPLDYILSNDEGTFLTPLPMLSMRLILRYPHCFSIAPPIDDGNDDDGPDPGSQLHVRGIGVHGWDGTDNGEGEFENEEALGVLFGQFGKFLHCTVRHRIQDPNSPEPKMRGPRANASWALVTMADKEAGEKAFAAAESDKGLMAGGHRLKVTRFSKKVAKSSTGKMGAVLQADKAHVLATLDSVHRNGWLALLNERKLEFPSQKSSRNKCSPLAQIFQELDTDGSGDLDKAELAKLLVRLGQKVSETSVDMLMEELDEDGGGEVSLSELEEWWAKQDPALMSLMSWSFFDTKQLIAVVSTVAAPFNWLLAQQDEEGQLAVVKAGTRNILEIGDWLEEGSSGSTLYAFVRLEWAVGDRRTSKWLTIRCEEEGQFLSQVQDSKVRVALSPHDVFYTASNGQLGGAEAFIGRLQGALSEQSIKQGWEGLSLAACEQVLAEDLKQRVKEVQREMKKEDRKAARRASVTLGDASKAMDEAAQAAAAVSEGVPPKNGEPELEPEPQLEEEDSSSEDESSDDELDSDEDDYERKRKLPTIGRDASDVRIVVDQGYGSTRFGVAGEKLPTQLSNTTNPFESGEYKYMIERQNLDAMCVDWAMLETQWTHIFETELDVEGDNTSVLCTISPYGSLEYAETLAELLFETLETNGLYFTNPALLSLYAQGKTTGLILDSGECTTSAFPVFDGIINKHAVKTIPFGGRDITTYVGRELIMEYGDDSPGIKGLNLESYATNVLLTQMKEDLCYCDAPRPSEAKAYALPDGSSVTIGGPDDTHKFPYRAPEHFFFNPLKLDWADTKLEESVPAMIMECLMDCQIDTRKKLTENVLLAGANTLFDGLPEMLFKKTKVEGKERTVTLKLAATAVREHSAWLGGTIIAKMPAYLDQLVTPEEYEEEGPRSVHRHNVLADDTATQAA